MEKARPKGEGFFLDLFELISSCQFLNTMEHFFLDSFGTNHDLTYDSPAF
jgi:hypothetical protein